MSRPDSRDLVVYLEGDGSASTNWSEHVKKAFDYANTGFEGLEDVLCVMFLCALTPDRADPKKPSERRSPNRHILLEGAAGTGKSELSKAFARVLPHQGKDAVVRVQGTPDLTPMDFLGRESGSGFAPGPLLKFEQPAGAHAPVPDRPAELFIDEINRIPPRTLSVALQAMSENEVSIPTTVRADRAALSEFLVVATQNPGSHVGTFPSPEALMDRFMVRLVMPFPNAKMHEDLIVEATEGAVATAFELAADGMNQWIQNTIIDDTKLSPQITKLTAAYSALPDAKVKPLTPASLQAEHALREAAFFFRGTPVTKSSLTDGLVTALNELEEHIKSLPPAEPSRPNATQDERDGAKVIQRTLLNRIEAARESVEQATAPSNLLKSLPDLRRKIAKVRTRGIAALVVTSFRATISRRAADREGVTDVIALTDVRTHVDDIVSDGAKFRGGLALADLAAAVAWCRSPANTDLRDITVTRDDVLRISPYVLSHRVMYIGNEWQAPHTQLEWMRELAAILDSNLS